MMSQALFIVLDFAHVKYTCIRGEYFLIRSENPGRFGDNLFKTSVSEDGVSMTVLCVFGMLKLISCFLTQGRGQCFYDIAKNRTPFLLKLL